MIKTIIYGTIDGERKELLSDSDINKADIKKIIGFTVVSQEQENSILKIEEFVVGIPYEFENFDASHFCSKYLNLYPDDLLYLIRYVGKRTTSENANCYINTITKLPMKKNDNMHIVKSQRHLLKLLRKFAMQKELIDDDKRAISSVNRKPNIRKRTIR